MEFLWIIFGFYFFFTIALLVGWFIALQASLASTKIQCQQISVIVPFRNEAHYLGGLLQTLYAQSYSQTDFEIICVDDQSDDGSANVVEHFSKHHHNIRLLRLPPHLMGKKHAIACGVAASRFELIAITDADCVVPERWLESINTYFTSDINLLVGAVKIEPSNNFFSKLQAMEFASLIGAGFATLSLGLPTMANGANMAFRKSTFEKVNGYEGTLHIASGDDEHLMHKVAKQFPTTVRVMTTARSVVSTKPKSSLKEFEQQRLRWAAKWKSNQSFFSKSLAVFIFLFQVTYFLALFSLFFTFGNTRELALLLATKWFLEFLFLYAVHLFLNLEWNWISFLILQFVYPLYVMYIAIISFFSPAHVWKDRELY